MRQGPFHLPRLAFSTKLLVFPFSSNAHPLATVGSQIKPVGIFIKRDMLALGPLEQMNGAAFNNFCDAAAVGSFVSPSKQKDCGLHMLA